MFMNKYDWYEEYLIIFSFFVLNGFMYFLIGLYDLKEIVGEKFGKEVKFLYERGMEFLKVMFFLYDIGLGIIYDFRYFMFGIVFNLVRWDYYIIYIN